MITDENPWFVYLVRCCDGTLYCGVTTDVQRRVNEHNTSTKGSRYTRARRPVYAVYKEGPYSRSEALRREIVVKRLRRALKDSLIDGDVRSGGPDAET